MANSRTEVLLTESQRLATQLQERSDELQRQQAELRRSNAELEDKAALLAKQNRAIEVQNFQIDQARRTLEERAQQLAISSQYKSEFLANMSHELRTPLNSLLVLAKLLSENLDGNLTVKQIEFARTIHEAGADLLQLINDILDLSKVEAGKMEVHPAAIALDTLLDYVDATFRPTAAQKGLTFEIEVNPDVPALIYSDEQRLQQILRNLLSNAVKFTAAGGVTLRVAKADPAIRFAGPLRDEASVLAFAVTDTGIGIAEPKLELIFGAFQQADGTTSRGYGGTGLGLSISRDIARLLGGEIRATSRLGHGSTFTFYLTGRQAAGTAAGSPVPMSRSGSGVSQTVPADSATALASAGLPGGAVADSGSQPGTLPPALARRREPPGTRPAERSEDPHRRRRCAERVRADQRVRAVRGADPVRGERPAGNGNPGSRRRHRAGIDGCHDAGTRRVRHHRGDPAASRIRRPADHHGDR